KDAAHKAWLKADRVRREKQLIFELGYWAHFVGDGSQPLHVTYHYNGWGPYPNPKGYTTERIHAPFEGDFVNHNLTMEGGKGALPPPRRLRPVRHRRHVRRLPGQHPPVRGDRLPDVEGRRAEGRQCQGQGLRHRPGGGRGGGTARPGHRGLERLPQGDRW